MTDESGPLDHFVAVTHGRSGPLSGPLFPRRKFGKMVLEAGLEEWRPRAAQLTVCAAVTLPLGCGPWERS